MKKRTLIVLFNLKSGVDEKDYEKWAQDVDLPIAGSLKSVDDFKIFKVEGVFGSSEAPPYKYIEFLQINDFDNLPTDISSEPKMEEVASKFQSLADSPVFLVTEKFAG